MVAVAASIVSPAASGATTKTPTLPSPVLAGTSSASAWVAYGTPTFSPSSRHAEPSAVAVVAGALRKSVPGSWTAAVSSEVPATTGGNHRCCCSSVPNRAIGIAPIPTVASSGTGATFRPTCSNSTHSSPMP